MSLLLTLEQGPRTQAVRQTRLDEGELVIGRSADAGWQIDDPDMFVSRAHCKITGGQDGYFVTDTSSSGLFINDSDSPLGAGRSARLQSGMRLRLGDYILHVDLQAPAMQPPATSQPVAERSPPASRAPVSIGNDDFFSARAEEEPRRPRPAELPNPFEQPLPGAFERANANQGSSQAFDDPFSLDPVPSLNGMAEPVPAKPSPIQDDFGFGPATPSGPANGGWPAGERERAAERPQPANPWDLPVQAAEPPPPPRVASGSRPARAPAAAPSQSDMALRNAFLRGMGVEEADFPGRDAIAEMAKFGREYRLMMEGLMQLLRKRSEEKGNARVAQTMVGASEVNPLKFLPTVDDAIVTILGER
ncbi:type VI secretion system-associated FHA domain protein TagH, partial [Mesorhizobium sp. M4A.F.Ca.ET.020.02.1.1]